MKLNSRTWEIVYTGKLADVAGILDEQRRPIFQTMTKKGDLTGWRYNSNLAQAKKAADEDGK
jgi:hypothetical protein